MKYIIVLFLVIASTIQVLNAQCIEDCVWPGDLNANGIANNLDILAIGFSIGETGPARDNPMNTWEAFAADDWAGSLPGLNKNFKHSDADGNGVVNADDQFPVSINYNQVNDSFAGLLGNNLIGDDLFVVPENVLAAPSGSFFMDIHLGTAEKQIEDIYGIGFQIDVDTQYVREVNFDFSESWIGIDEEIFAYGKYSDEIEDIGMAITRLDGTTVSGFGKIARIEIVITDVVLGLVTDSTACLPFLLNFQNVLGINEFEEDLLIEARGDSLALKNESQFTSNEEIINHPGWTVFPNPVKNRLNIRTTQEPIESLILYDLLGRVLIRKRFETISNDHITIDLSPVPGGLYFIELQGRHSKLTQKIQIE